MYLEYYGLCRKPFSKTPDPSMLFESPEHGEALARMEQAVEDRELMVLTGEIGCGKTTLSRALLDRLPEEVRPALIINPRLSPNQLLRTIAMRLGAENPKRYRCDLIEQVHDLLYACHEGGVLPLLIVDEAQTIPARETFEEIRLLTNFQLDDRNLLAVLLMGQPELGRRLRRPAYEALRQRIGLSYHLGPLPRASVGEYLRFRLRAAGRAEPLFTSEAVEAIAELSRGIPRWVNNIAAAALLEGFGREEAEVDRALVEDAAHDLGLSRAEDDDPEPARAAEPGAAAEVFRD
jgi:type II secretory pathway predicted ATPase ExeA